MKIVLIGPPGSGKGTQAELVCNKTGFLHYSTGDHFRAHIIQKSPLGIKIEEYVTKGLLVPDEIVLEVTDEFIKENNNKGIVFDGFPRTLTQAEGLDNILRNRMNQLIDLVVFIKLSQEEVIKRLSARRVCANCGTIYNLISHPPKFNGKCDNCEGRLYQRNDDKPETIIKRFRVYEQSLEPVLDYYRKQQKLQVVNGALAPDKVFEQIKGLLSG